jgi:hypothetical protein
MPYKLTITGALEIDLPFQTKMGALVYLMVGVLGEELLETYADEIVRGDAVEIPINPVDNSAKITVKLTKVPDETQSLDTPFQPEF